MTPMELAVEKARQTMRAGIGGPFGAAITDARGEVIAVASNRVLSDHDPTAHAEIMAIRAACCRLGTHDLSGCTLYATGYPCPMCLSAMIWANITDCRYGNDLAAAGEIGFRDNRIYDFIRGGLTDHNTLRLRQEESEDCRALYAEYHESQKQMY